jgi:hypothetical protein
MAKRLRPRPRKDASPRRRPGECFRRARRSHRRRTASRACAPGLPPACALISIGSRISALLSHVRGGRDARVGHGRAAASPCGTERHIRAERDARSRAIPAARMCPARVPLRGDCRSRRFRALAEPARASKHLRAVPRTSATACRRSTPTPVSSTTGLSDKLAIARGGPSQQPPRDDRYRRRPSHKPRPLYELHNARFRRPRESASGGKSGAAATEVAPQEIVPL